MMQSRFVSARFQVFSSSCYRACGRPHADILRQDSVGRKSELPAGDERFQYSLAVTGANLIT